MKVNKGDSSYGIYEFCKRVDVMNLLFLTEHVMETLYRAETNTLCPISRPSYAELLYYCKQIAKPAVLPNKEC